MGKFIVIEGIDGAGKSTVIEYLKKHLPKGRVLFTREPGGTPMGESMRGLLGMNINPITELLLISAARSEHVEKTIIPALDDGYHVITDRFVASTYAYQLYGREVIYAHDLWGRITRMVLSPHDKKALRPDFSVFLSIDPQEGLRRNAGKKVGIEKFEEEGLAFARRSQEGYERYFHYYCPAHKKIDASRSIEAVSEEVLSVVKEKCEL